MPVNYLLDVRTATPHFPGIGRYVANLARELPSLLQGEEALHLLVSPDQQSQWQGVAPLLVAAASPFSLAQQWQVPAVLRRVATAARTSSPSGTSGMGRTLYHSSYYLMPYCPGVPTVLTFYDLIPISFPTYVALRARLLFRLTTRLACRAAQQIVSISEASRQDLIAHFGVDPAKVTTTPLAPDPRFQPQSQTEMTRIRQKYNLPDSFFLYFGINKPHKNLVSLVEAYAHLSPTTHRPPLVIAGAWDTRYPQAKEMAAQKKLTDSVRFLGRIEDRDLPGLYSAASAFVFPSRYEGFGLPVLEAMACGTPVACSNTSSLPEVAGDAALLFDPTDIQSITRTLQQLLEDASGCERLTQRGLQQAARFTWSHTARLTVEVYRKS